MPFRPGAVRWLQPSTSIAASREIRATATCALSTAFALMPVETIAATLRGLPPVEASLPSHDGTAALLRGG